MEPEDQNQGNSFFKESKEKIKSAGEKAKKAKKAFKIFMKLPTPVKIAIIAIPLGIVLLMLLFAGGAYLLDILGFENIFNAKASAMGTGIAYSTKVVKIEDGKWILSLNDEIKTELENAGIETKGMTQEELLIEYLKLKGLSEEDLTQEEINILPYLIKAEIATQQLDLRKAKDMYKDDGTYSAPDTKDMKKNSEICGTIHLRRVNTSDLSNPILLEYIDYETFKQTMEKENPTQDDYNNIKGYFSINDEGNAVIATWNYNKVTYTLDDGYISNPYNGTSTFQNSENYILSEMTIDYKPLVNKYTLPFEVLTALLINSEDVNFVEEVANLAFSANIEITIAEEMTETNKTYITNYYETIRNYQYICMLANKSEVEGYQFLAGDFTCDNANDVIEDEGLSGFSGVTPPADIHNCTYKDINFTNDKSSYTVKQNIEIKDNTYKYGITYADTWFIKATKDISRNTTTDDLQEQGSMIEDTYKYDKTDESKSTNIPTTIEKEYLEKYYEDNKLRIQKKVEQQIVAQEKATVFEPKVSNVSGSVNQIKIEYYKQIKQIIGSNGNLLKGEGDPVSGGLVTSGVGNNLKVVDIDDMTFTFTKNDKGEWNCDSFTPNVTVDYKQKTIKYKRTDIETSIAYGSTTTKYELIEGTPIQTIYDKEDEKFLKAYDESSTAKGNMSSTPGWLEEMTDKYDSNFSTIIMYLLDTYYGRNTSQYDITGIEEIYSLGEFNSIMSIRGSIIVKLDEPQALKELNKQQIIDVINNYFTVKEARDNFLGVIDDLVYIQDTYKVNAIFAMAIIKKESSGGIGWDLIDRKTYNWASVTGTYKGKSYQDRNGRSWREYSSFNEATRDLGELIGKKGPYFSKGNYTVESIGTEYCKPPEAWIDEISKYIVGMYESIGESIYTFTSDGNDMQKNVAEIAMNSTKYGIIPEKGYCQGWVANVYSKAGVNGGRRISADSAVQAGKKWGVSKDWNTIQLGATVYGYSYKSANPYGHVGIYIGNGQVAHNIGYVKIDDLQDWIKKYDGICWGWNGGIDLTGGAFPSKEGLM